MEQTIKTMAEKFLAEENISTKSALLMASLGLQKSVGDIAELTYGINFNQHPFNEDRKKLLAEYLGYVLWNWQLLATAADLNGDEVVRRFAEEWRTKHSKVSIKDLLKHLKSTTKTQEQQKSAPQQEQVKGEPTPTELTHTR